MVVVVHCIGGIFEYLAPAVVGSPLNPALSRGTHSSAHQFTAVHQILAISLSVDPQASEQ